MVALLVLVILLNEAGKLPSCSGTIFLALRAALWAFNLFLKAPICTNQSSWTFSEYKVLVVLGGILKLFTFFSAITILGALKYKEIPDLLAILGLGLIILGVILLVFYSKMGAN